MLTNCVSKEGSSPAKATPAKACFVYGDGEDGNPTSTYMSDSPFPTSVEEHISSLFPLTNVSIAASSLITGNAGATFFSSPASAVIASTSVSSQTTAKASSMTASSQTIGKTATTSTPPRITSTPAPTTSTSASTTGQSTASGQKSAAEGTRPIIAKVYFLVMGIFCCFLLYPWGWFILILRHLFCLLYFLHFLFVEISNRLWPVSLVNTVTRSRISMRCLRKVLSVQIKGLQLRPNVYEWFGYGLSNE